MRKPVEKHDIYIVGEAYSFGQGWVEGALDTAESTLQEYFGLKQPQWLNMYGNTLMPNPCLQGYPAQGCGNIREHHAACVPVNTQTSDLKDITPSCLKEGPIQ
jgi:monoamine oxidase